MSIDRTASTIFVVAGAAGSGKSTFGHELAAVTDAVALDQDTATNPLMQQLAALVGAGDDLDFPALRGPVRQARYQCLVDVAVDNCRLGRDVVMIAPFTAESSDSAAWAALADRFRPASVYLVWVSVPPEIAVARRAQRGLPRDRVVADFSGRLPPVGLEPVVDHLTVSGTADARNEAIRIAGLTTQSR